MTNLDILRHEVRELETYLDGVEYEFDTYIGAGARGKIFAALNNIMRDDKYIPVGSDIFLESLSPALHGLSLISIVYIVEAIFLNTDKMNYILNINAIAPEVGLVRTQHVTDMRWDTSVILFTHIPTDSDDLFESHTCKPYDTYILDMSHTENGCSIVDTFITSRTELFDKQKQSFYIGMYTERVL